MVWARWLRALAKRIMAFGKMTRNMVRVHFGLSRSRSLSGNSSTTKKMANLKPTFLMGQSQREFGWMMLKRTIRRLYRSLKLASRMIHGLRKSGKKCFKSWTLHVCTQEARIKPRLSSLTHFKKLSALSGRTKTCQNGVLLKWKHGWSQTTKYQGLLKYSELTR